MDHTHFTSIDKPILDKILSNGGDVWPEVGAIDAQGWAVLLDVNTDCINKYIRDNHIRHKRIAASNWILPQDIWDSFEFENEAVEPLKKGRK